MANAVPQPGARDNPRLRKVLIEGFDHLRAGDLEAARAIFTDVIARQPQSVPAHIGLGRVCFRENDLQAALQSFQKALTHDPNSALARVQIARVREALGDSEAALYDYMEASEINPALGIVQRRLSQILVEEDDYDEAVARLRQALQYNPQQVATRLLLATTLERAGSIAAAKTEFQRVLDLDPDNWVAAYRIGQLHRGAGENSAARPFLEQAMRLAPQTAAPGAALAAALKELGEYDQALAVLRDVQHRQHSSPSSLGLMIADCQIKLGQPEEALKTLRQASRQARPPAGVHKRLGDLLTALKRYSEAIEEYRAAMLRQPKVREKRPDLVALIDKAQTPGENHEEIAKQIHTMMLAIAAERQAARTETGVLDGGTRAPRRRARRRRPLRRRQLEGAG